MVTNSKKFDQQLIDTGYIFPVSIIDEPMFDVIQKHRPGFSIPLDFNKLQQFNSELTNKQLYLTTDVIGLYMLDENTLTMWSIYLDTLTNHFDENTWKKYITTKENSIQYIVDHESNIDKLANKLVNKIISTKEKSQQRLIFELLLTKTKLLVNNKDFKELKQLLTVLTRKELDVFFEEFDNKYTYQLDYRYNDTKKITIYRGENSKSQSYKNTFSWTTNKNIALEFAQRFENSKLLTAAVPKNKILYIYDNDPESEVLVKGSDLENVKTTKKLF